MSQPRAFHRKETKNLKSCEEATAHSEAFTAPPPEEANHCPQPCGKSRELLAPDGSRGHDSEVWRVTDDWPEIVPITSDEVEVIESFMRQILDDLLK